MKILLVYGSPRKNGNTDSLAQKFKKGAMESGHEVKEFYVRDKKMNPCLACDYCQNHKGICIQKDDYQEAFELMQECEMVVIAAPVYYLGIPGNVKIFIDRTYAESAIGRRIRKSAFLTAACKKEPEVTRVMTDYYLKLADYLGWENKGIVCAYGVNDKGDIAGMSCLEEAYQLGKSFSF